MSTVGWAWGDHEAGKPGPLGCMSELAVESQGSERGRHLSEITQLVRGEVGIQTKITIP